MGMHGFPKNPRVVLLAMAALFLTLKILAALAFIPGGQTLFQLDFGFGEYIESLHTSGSLAFCRKTFCTHATRMPLIPWIYHLMAYVTTSAVVAALIKNVVMSLVVVWGFRYLLAYQGTLHRKALGSWCWSLLIVVLSPAVIKHSSAVTYEEGILIELGLLWAFSFLLGVRLLAEPGTEAQAGPVVLAVLLAVVIYMAKSSMLPLLAASVALGGWVALRQRHLAALGAVVFALALTWAWGARNEAVTGRFSIMTSWDGENMYRGASDIGYQLYPDVMLDRIFDSDEHHLRDGRVIRHPRQPSIGAFQQEWAWNDHYKNEAIAWVKTNPGKAWRYTLAKLFNFFIGIEKTPYQYQSDGSEIPQRFSAQNLLTMGWLLAGRVLELAMMGLMCWHATRPDRGSRFLAVGVLVVNAAYAAPYVLGFNYERHVTPYLVIVAACTALMLAQWREQRSS